MKFGKRYKSGNFFATSNFHSKIKLKCEHLNESTTFQTHVTSWRHLTVHFALLGAIFSAICQQNP